MSIIKSFNVIFVVIFLFMFREINCNGSPRVIIVGAGAAGIAAATRLVENNITNVKILEARNRIGGRIYSIKFGDAIVDLGAQWCYGENNIVYELAKDYNILENGESMVTLYHSSHEEIDLALVNELYEIFYSIYTEEVEGDEVSLGEYITRRYNETVLAQYGSNKEKLKFAFEFLRYFKKAILTFEGSFSIYDVAARSDFKKCEEKCGMHFKGNGYKRILDIVMKKYPNPEEQLPVEEKIFLNKEVVKIIWDKSEEFDEIPAVQCSDGTIYKADHIIFTPSVGVLKYNYGTLFEPSLPEEKIDAIKDIGIASIFKVYLHFPIRWWPKRNFTDFSFLWVEKDRQLLLQEFLNGPKGHGMSWLLDLTAVHDTPENPNVLEAWFCGEFVPKIEKCSDKTIIDGVMFVLNKFVGFYFDNITRPDSIIRHNWYSDPHFRGSFSFQTVESRKKRISQEIMLSEPILSSSGKQTLLFAGEATHKFLFSTVNGAIETGFREADRIINFYK
ncbi:hypothetical protein ILUMI_09681 [Ignelater luminosus]|uniref:Amine oxidase domain-containing protein n=1 Tax=Ignelater luminosus TaxID=2038154 RepID=A0A8K0D4L8_IGNLU|nr:hypothetical protein ILUMI_09681 [Ignelater luminosus]